MRFAGMPARTEQEDDMPARTEQKNRHARESRTALLTSEIAQDWSIALRGAAKSKKKSLIWRILASKFSQIEEKIANLADFRKKILHN